METQEKNFIERVNESLSQSITIKLLSVGILILLLLIPQSMIESLIRERENRMVEAINEVSDKWSGEQTITGPIITIPYEKLYRTSTGNIGTEYHNAYLLSHELDIQSEVLPEKRHRGIYDVVVYNTHLIIKGSFKPDFEALGIEANEIKWKEITVNLGIDDLRGIVEENVQLTWNNKKTPFNPGVSRNDMISSGIHAILPVKTIDSLSGEFSISLKLRGSENLFFIPTGKETNVRMTSVWNDPSFTGAFLPNESDITNDGFSASWKVLHFNRNYPQQWTDSKYNFRESSFGVNLFVTTGNYQKTSRSSKYAILVISLSFLIFFLVEVTQKLRIHPFQYILIGLGLIIFYALLLSISEHIGFNPAYIIASASVIGLITLYSLSVLRKTMFSLLLMLFLSFIYGFIYIIIQLETYALLVGSAGLFIIIALTMYGTRNINWYNDRKERGA